MNVLFGSVTFGTHALQSVAWLIALAETCMLFYVLLHRWRYSVVRYLGALLLLITVPSYAAALLTTAQASAQSMWLIYILVAAPLVIQPFLIVATITVLRPNWLQGRRRWLLAPLHAIAFLPVLLLYFDVVTGAQIWFTGLDPQTYTGGFVAIGQLTAGTYAFLIHLVYRYLLALASCGVALYVALRDQDASRPTRWMAWLLLLSHLIAIVIHLFFQDVLPAGFPSLISGAIYSLVYIYVGLSRLRAERSVRKGQLPARISALVLLLVVPLLVILISFTLGQVEELVARDAAEQLRATNNAISLNMSMWLDLNGRILQNIAARPEIISMEAEQQKPLLEQMALIYPYMYLISTTDGHGQNVARSDDRPLQQYRTQLWYIAAKNGAPLTFEIIVDKVTGEPAIVASTPIQKDTLTFSGIVGVAMFASQLTHLNEVMQTHQIGEDQIAYIVDAQNRVVMHSDPTFEVGQQEPSTYYPVFALRDGERGLIVFEDDEGRPWRAHVNGIANDWGVIVQQQDKAIFQPVAMLRQVSWQAIVAVTLALALLMWAVLRWTFRPIDQMTEAVAAVAEGDLTQRSRFIQRHDEIGALSQAINRAFDRLGEMIHTLQEQAALRSRELERRSAYTQASAEVGRTASTILDADQLIQEIVELIQNWFDLYYVGLFLTDEAEEWAELHAGTGEAGKAMLARRHRIRVGQGMIGWSIANAQSRVALHAEEDAVRLATAELPDTRSEAALPLRSRGQVIGALTVQSDRVNAFDEDFIAILQNMADQVAVALNNAHLYTASQAALEAARRAYSEMSQEAWVELIRSHSDPAYRCGAGGVTQVDERWSPTVEEALRIGETIRGNGRPPDQSDDAERAAAEGSVEGLGEGAGEFLSIPIKVREDADPIGVLETHKEGRWTDVEINLLEALADQLGIALEGARLYQEAQRRAARERLTREITDEMRSAVEVDHIIQAAVDEIFDVLGASHAFVRLGAVEALADDLVPSSQSGHSSEAGDSDIKQGLSYD
jgi:GAF domain-containing protein